MKLILTLLLTVTSLMFAGFASSAGLENMTDSEREIFRAEVRAYLLDNPEVILEAVKVLEDQQAAAETVSDFDLVRANYQALAFDGFSFVGGNPDGAITIVEFSDYRCAFCKRAFPEVEKILENNADVRFVLKEFPILGPDSVLASRAAISILVNQGPEIYQTFHNALMIFNGPVNQTTLAKLANESGANVTLMQDHMNDPAVDQIIGANHALAQTMQITGTPTFIIGPNMLRGFAPYDNMQKIVEAARNSLQQ